MPSKRKRLEARVCHVAELTGGSGDTAGVLTFVHGSIRQRALLKWSRLLTSAATDTNASAATDTNASAATRPHLSVGDQVNADLLMNQNGEGERSTCWTVIVAWLGIVQPPPRRSPISQVAGLVWNVTASSGLVAFVAGTSRELCVVQAGHTVVQPSQESATGAASAVRSADTTRAVDLTRCLFVGQPVVLDSAQPKRGKRSHWLADKVQLLRAAAAPRSASVASSSERASTCSGGGGGGWQQRVFVDRVGCVESVTSNKAVLVFSQDEPGGSNNEHNGWTVSRALLWSTKYGHTGAGTGIVRDLTCVLRVGNWVQFTCHPYDRRSATAQLATAGDACDWLAVAAERVTPAQLAAGADLPLRRRARQLQQLISASGQLSSRAASQSQPSASAASNRQLTAKSGKVCEVYRHGGLVQFAVNARRCFAYFARGDIYVDGQPCDGKLKRFIEVDTLVNFDAVMYAQQASRPVLTADWRCVLVWRGERPITHHDKQSAETATAGSVNVGRRADQLDDFGIVPGASLSSSAAAAVGERWQQEDRTLMPPPPPVTRQQSFDRQAVPAGQRQVRARQASLPGSHSERAPPSLTQPLQRSGSDRSLSEAAAAGHDHWVMAALCDGVWLDDGGGSGGDSCDGASSADGWTSGAASPSAASIGSARDIADTADGRTDDAEAAISGAGASALQAVSSSVARSVESERSSATTMDMWHQQQRQMQEQIRQLQLQLQMYQQQQQQTNEPHQPDYGDESLSATGVQNKLTSEQQQQQVEQEKEEQQEVERQQEGQQGQEAHEEEGQEEQDEQGQQEEREDSAEEQVARKSQHVVERDQHDGQKPEEQHQHQMLGQCGHGDAGQDCTQSAPSPSTNVCLVGKASEKCTSVSDRCCDRDPLSLGADTLDVGCGGVEHENAGDSDSVPLAGSGDDKRGDIENVGPLSQKVPETSQDLAHHASTGSTDGERKYHGRGIILAFVDATCGLAEWTSSVSTPGHDAASNIDDQLVMFERACCWHEGDCLRDQDVSAVFREGEEVVFECVPASSDDGFQWRATRLLSASVCTPRCETASLASLLAV